MNLIKELAGLKDTPVPVIWWQGEVIATPVAFLGCKFVDLPAGTYCVKVINNSVEDVGTYALIARNNRNEKVYSLGENQDSEDLDQGFPYVCP